MARLPYKKPGSSPAADQLYADITRMGRPVLNLYQVLANQPPALEAFLGMSRYVRSASTLDAGLRELAILATAAELGQEYELLHHTDAAQQAGVDAAKVAVVKSGGSLEALSQEERCAVDFARQAARTRSCDDATFHRLETLFSKGQIVDLVVTTAWYHLCAVILGSLRVELEAETR